MMPLRTIVFRYALFAVIATVVNLATQRLVLQAMAAPYELFVAIFFGTLFGLVVKYVLDKYWIFGDRRSDIGTHGRQFSLYTLMGVATTAIFWGFEYSFYVIGGTDFMRELGAVIGLTIGYVTKFFLDKRFVFDANPAVLGKAAT